MTSSQQNPTDLSIGSDANLLDNEESAKGNDSTDNLKGPSNNPSSDEPIQQENEDISIHLNPQYSSPASLVGDLFADADDDNPNEDATRPSVVIHDVEMTRPNDIVINLSPRQHSLEHQNSTVSTVSTKSYESVWDEQNQPELDLSLPIQRQLSAGTRESVPIQTTTNNNNNTNNPPQTSSVPVQGYYSPPQSPRQSLARNNLDIQLETGGDVARPGRAEVWCSPTRILDCLMHKFYPTRILLMLLNWLPVFDYAKDTYVAWHLFEIGNTVFAIVTVALMYLSLRVMLLVRATDDTIAFWKLFLFYVPGSVYCDFQIDRASDYGVCCCWEILVDLGTPLMPFYLTFLAGNKTISMLCGDTNFEHPHLLSFSVVEFIFETMPQFAIQTYLRVVGAEVDEVVFDVALAISIATLLKIPLIVWYNWRIVHRLEFKRRHNGEVTAVAFHPSRDLVATGSWDHTVIINNIVVDIVKAKRVLDHHYNVNSICFSHDGQMLAVGGQGVELWDWATGTVIDHYPKPPPRDRIGRRQRVRTDEVTSICFSLEDDIIYTAEGKYLVAYKVKTKEVVKKIRAQRDRLGQIKMIALSPNGKYLAAALYVGVVKVWDTRSWKQVRRLKAHTSEVSCVTFDRTGQYILTGSADTNLLIWDFQRGKVIGKGENPHDGEVTCVCVDYENKMALSGSRDRTLRVYNLQQFLSDYLKHKSEWEEKDREMERAIKKKSTSSFRKKTGDEVDIDSLPEMTSFLSRKRHDRDVLCAEFSPFDDTFISAGEDHNVHLFKVPTHMVPGTNG